MRQKKNNHSIFYIVIASTSLFLLLFSFQSATSVELKEDTKLWGNITAIGDVGHINPDFKRWLWWMEGQFRMRECCSSNLAPQQSLIRPGVGYALSKESSIWLGYAHFRNYLYGPGQRTQENRMWEQYMWLGTTPLGPFLFRSRLEQRWFSNSDNMLVRFRQFLKFSWPIAFLANTNFVIWDEVFFNLYDTNTSSNVSANLQSSTGFDQNRGFVGLGYYFTKKIWTEVGYLNQYIKTRSPKNDDLNHIISLTLFINASSP